MTNIGQVACRALGFTGFTYVTAVEYEPMMGFGYNLGRDVGCQGAFGLDRCLRVFGQSDAVRYSKNMCINGHGGLSKDNGKDYIGCLTPYPGIVSNSSIVEGT